jgi:flagellar basal body-associated protein FliL
MFGLGIVLAYSASSGMRLTGGFHMPASLQGALQHKSTASNLFYLEPLIVNGPAAEGDATAFVRLTLTLELDRPEVAEDLQTRLPALQNQVIIAATSRESRTLLSSQEKARLRDELTDRINALLPHGGVRAVYFADFLIR